MYVRVVSLAPGQSCDDCPSAIQFSNSKVLYYYRKHICETLKSMGEIIHYINKTQQSSNSAPFLLRHCDY